VQRGNEVIALEITAIEGKYAFHCVNVHGSGIFVSTRTRISAHGLHTWLRG